MDDETLPDLERYWNKLRGTRSQEKPITQVLLGASYPGEHPLYPEREVVKGHWVSLVLSPLNLGAPYLYGTKEQFTWNQNEGEYVLRHSFTICKSITAYGIAIWEYAYSDHPILVVPFEEVRQVSAGNRLDCRLGVPRCLRCGYPIQAKSENCPLCKYSQRVE